MIVLQDDDACAALDLQYLGRGRNAVADRGDQCDVGGIGLDQPRSGRPRPFVLMMCERSVECPGRALAPDRGAASFQRSQRQWAVGGRIQIADMTRHLEQGAL